MILLKPFSSVYITSLPSISVYYPSNPISSIARKTQPFSIHSSSVSMDSSSSTAPEIAQDYSPFLRIYKNGRIERLKGTEVVPPSLDPRTKVSSKDVMYSPDLNLTCRLYLPENTTPGQKLPLLVYYHGGGFVVETPFTPNYHNYVNTIVAEANIMAVSVDYRLAPEHPLPAAYEDSWAALKWVASHVNGDGPEEWINSHADLRKVFLVGDSAGANIAHQMCIRNGQERLPGIDLVGAVLIHPYFWGKDPIGNEAKEQQSRAIIDGVWHFACPTTSGSDDPLINPVLDPKLASLGCEKVLVIVAEKDFLRDRGLDYHEKLKESGWGGVVEIMEVKEEGHVFHLENWTCDNAVAMLKAVSSFINKDRI